MTNKYNNVKEFLNDINSDLTNTSKQDFTIKELENLIVQFKEFDLDTAKLEQLRVFVQNEDLFGKTNIYSEVRKVVAKLLHFINSPDFDVRRQLFMAVCQDAYNGDNKAVSSLYSQLKCMDSDGTRGLISDFTILIPWADKLLKNIKKLFNDAE